KRRPEKAGQTVHATRDQGLKRRGFDLRPGDVRKPAFLAPGLACSTVWRALPPLRRSSVGGLIQRGLSAAGGSPDGIHPERVS
ncbi:hypothetical protein, partial [Enterobacter sp. PTB]|uniref:hypothetical protein n=1 Tax=Enterobacter sp. PTB TaxID=3143437 RepID=UPI003DAA23F9